MAAYYINDSAISVHASNPAGAVAKNLRMAGYKARAKGNAHVECSLNTAEICGGTVLVYGKTLFRPFEVTLGGQMPVNNLNLRGPVPAAPQPVEVMPPRDTTTEV